MIKEDIKNLIVKTIKKQYGFVVGDVLVQRPTQMSHGDYSTNVALILARQLKKSPHEIATILKSNLEKSALFKKVEVVGGFINFFLGDAIFYETIKNILKGKFPNIRVLKGQKIMVEHTQPNPFKAFHIGHLMNNAIGESLARMITVGGAKVKTASYHGDIGLHVAKAIWAMQKGILLQEAYAFGHKGYEENDQNKKEILEINKKIYDNSDSTIKQFYKTGKEQSLAEFESMYRQLGSRFNYHFYESETAQVGKKLVLKNIGKVFKTGDNGAIIFKGEDFEPKTHTRVFINSEGLPTYEAKEIGLAKIKKDQFSYNASLTVTANEQDSFFDVVEVAIGEVFPTLKGRMHHVSHGILKLPSGKMSSRTGTVITAEDLINQVKERVLEKMKENDLNNKDEVAQAVAIGAIKYSILKQSIGSDIIFDTEKSISFEGDSGAYLQYSYARANSVLQKAKEQNIKPNTRIFPEVITLLEKELNYFEEEIEKSIQEYQPHHVALYMAGLCREFNHYYAHHKIADQHDTFSPYKVALTQAFVAVMKQGLWLLGMEAPEKM